MKSPVSLSGLKEEVHNLDLRLSSETRSSLQTHEKDTLDRITRNATDAT